VSGILRKPAFWVAYAFVAIVALSVAARLFPLAIPILNVDVTMSRVEAIAAARTLATKLHLAPPGARVAARFSHDATTQNYVELEGGGKDAFAQLARGDRYAPFWWEVRLFTLGSIDETLVRLAPDGTPVGFARRMSETYVRDAARKAIWPRTGCSNSRNRPSCRVASITASRTSDPSRSARRASACCSP
jgi:hypothetical protein